MIIPPGTAVSLEMRAGQRLRIVDVHGQQVADFLAFNPANLDEFLSVGHTRGILGHLRPQRGMGLYTNARNAIFVLEEDTVGVHDMLLAPCDRRRYELDYGDPDHPACRENLHAALAGRVPYGRIPDTVSWFMNLLWTPDGRLTIVEPVSKPGDYVTLRAEADALVAISACPMDKNPCNAFRPTEIRIEIF
jgi:hypothetical protein